MEQLIIYSSAPAEYGFQGFVAALGMNLGQDVALRPLSELPAPDLLHQQRQRLLVERAELCLELDKVEAALARPLDVGERSGLEFHRQALLNRRLAIGRTLGEGGPANG